MVYYFIIIEFFLDTQSPLKTFARLRRWKNITGGDIQILFVHLLVMGIMKKRKFCKILVYLQYHEVELLWQIFVSKCIPNASV